MDAAVIGLAGTLGGAGVSALVAWAIARRTAKATDRTADAAFQQAMNDGFAKLTARYEALNTDLVERVEQLTGEVRDLTQHIESLEKILRDEGLPVPQRRKHPHPLARPPLARLQGGKIEE